MATKNIEPNLKLISDYTKLSGKEIFSIPVYQREYAWTIEQCDKLWQDITSFIASEADDPYFFGTVILDCSDSKKNKLNLIDGQQRTTTFLLLLKALHLVIRDTLKRMPKDDDDTEALRHALRNSNNKIFEILYKADEEMQVAISRDWKKASGRTILANQSINELYKDDFQKIIEAETFTNAEKSVEKIKYRRNDNKYTNFFRNFKFFYNKLLGFKETHLNKFAKAFLNKCQVIEIRSWDIEQAITMFNSLNSTGMPLSDANIISAQLFSKTDDEEKEEKFKEYWKDIKKRSDDLSKKKILTLDGILQQYMYIVRARKAEYVKNQVTTPGIRKYYTTEHPELLENPIAITDEFRKILDIWEKIVSYPVVKVLLKFNENSKLFLITYLSRYSVEDINKTVVTPIATLLLRLFALLEISDIGYSSSRFKTFLFNENLKLADAEVSFDEIAKDFNEHISSTWKRKALVDTIEEYDKNILIYLNDYLYSMAKGKPFDFADNVNIEHIMPSSGRNITTIQEDAGIESSEEFKRLVNSLGNKILLEEEINKSIGNGWFKTKKGKTITEKKGYLGSQFALASTLASYPKDLWEKEDIEASTRKAAGRILNFIFDEKGDEKEERPE